MATIHTVFTVISQRHNCEKLTQIRKLFRSFKTFLLNEFPTLCDISHMYLCPAIYWQLDTTIICYQREDTSQQIIEGIKYHLSDRCQISQSKKHHKWRCPQNKETNNQRRLELARNPREDNQCDICANHSPFHLLTDVSLPDEVFD